MMREMETTLVGRRIFVVEDESVITMLLQDMFEELRYEVVNLASRFQDALDKAKTLSFEVAILDVNLNGQRTFPIAEALTERGLPFVFATSYGTAAVPRISAMRTCCRSRSVSPIWNARRGRLWRRHRVRLDSTRGCATLDVFRGDLIEADRLAATLK
jgi:CheY-like chemotaxis protein